MTRQAARRERLGGVGTSPPRVAAPAPRRRPSWSPSRSHYRRSHSPAQPPSDPSPGPSSPPSLQSSSATPRSSPACFRDRSTLPSALPQPDSDQISRPTRQHKTTEARLRLPGYASACVRACVCLCSALRSPPPPVPCWLGSMRMAERGRAGRCPPEEDGLS
eukprot:COSAG02_NODE_2019_length_10091_cov_13.354283_6_plen_162_part_00